MATLSDAIEEYNGLANEAEALLTRDRPLPAMEAALIFQAVDLLASALATVEAHERRFAYALEALSGPLTAEQTPEEVKVSEAVS